MHVIDEILKDQTKQTDPNVIRYGTEILFQHLQNQTLLESLTDRERDAAHRASRNLTCNMLIVMIVFVMLHYTQQQNYNYFQDKLTINNTRVLQGPHCTIQRLLFQFTTPRSQYCTVQYSTVHYSANYLEEFHTNVDLRYRIVRKKKINL